MRVVCFDLDDTLFKEIDYLKSAYREIASYAAHLCTSTRINGQVLAENAYEVMLKAYRDGGNAFEALNGFLDLALPIVDLLQMYREHIPKISLDKATRDTLDRLKADGVLMGIVSDGREQTQYNKIRALGLREWMDESCIIVNSNIESFKPEPIGYERFEFAIRTLSDDTNWSFTYVGDNLKKDFIYPNKKGWQTICLEDDGRNIHKQDFSTTPFEAFPARIVKSIKELSEK